MNQACDIFLTAVIAVLGVLCLLCVIRSIIGPRIADRIVAVNMIGTMTMMIIVILAVKMKEGFLADVAIIYAMISFLAVVVLVKVFMGVYRERAEKGRAGGAEGEAQKRSGAGTGTEQAGRLKTSREGAADGTEGPDTSAEEEPESVEASEAKVRENRTERKGRTGRETVF
ncbi:MAG: cation:proton antiporter [Lachnospiraceae bacterium]|nr:cation:proton antiporter [Lachnospiraceae bacterium]